MIAAQQALRNPPEGLLDDIIRLQLKKPKSWNWELSTSKSSPHIALPTIQLYNSKGKLLVEARDDGMQRRTWHSSDARPPRISNAPGFGEPAPRHLRKCSSDILRRHRSDIPNKFGVISPSQKEWDVSKNRPTSSFRIFNGRTNILNENRALRNTGESAISSRNVKSPNLLRKSRSDVFGGTRDHSGFVREPTSLRKNRSARDLPRNLQMRPPSCHSRTRSDDLFQRMMKYNEESVKRAIADGYRNFITPLNLEKGVRDETTNDDVRSKNRRNRRGYTLEEAEAVSGPNTAQLPDINHFTHKRYRTRTCSAGTLIISEESFSGANRRRRRNKTEDAPGALRRDNAPASSRCTIDKSAPGHLRQGSNAGGAAKKGGPAQRRPDRYPLIVDLAPDKQEEASVKTPKHVNKRQGERAPLRADARSFECEEIGENGIGSRGRDGNCDDYLVQEPVTPGSDATERKLSGPIIVYLEKRNNAIKQASHQLSLSDTEEKDDEHVGAENNNKGRVPQPSRKDAAGDASLLGSARRLSSDHDKMGANVSRHSSKGLHGRRSQSSGSICNGKGRHASSSDTKMCGSLPSYLDDRNTSTCNNNHHDCEKPPLDGERIPPLGDAAPLHWKFSDTQAVLCDQGYGSERSPEEEYPPSLPGHDGQCPHHMEPHTCYPFITPESTFIVTLIKGSRGLGLSVTGGADSGGSWPGLIRIKRLFPHQPAATCGLLNVGDLLLEVNGITLTGLTNYEALEVLRTTPNQVELRVCRPPPDVLSCVSPISEVPPPPPRRDPPTSLNLTPPPYQPTPEDDLYHGEFDITLTKIQGSLGFTLRKEDDSALGHYVRALVREPALSDGRIRAGDKIIAVNDVEISSMSHEQAVQYLRQAGDVVTLRLYRDAAQTPVSTLSPTETTPRASFTRKAHLRPEALDMLNDIAMRKIVNHDMYVRSSSPNASPRRLRRQPYSSDSSQITNSSSKYLITDEQFHEGLFRKPDDTEDAYNSLFSVDSDECDRPSRPSSLDLCNSKGTPVITRKPKFNFSLAHNAYELNNLDPEILDAPNLTYNLGKDDIKSTEVECSDSFPQEPVSMPHIPSDNPGFSYKNPAYQSAHPPCGVESSEAAGADKSSKAADENNMKKWKGVVFNADEESKRRTKPENEYEILAIELNRGWNSRLGFSLQGAAGVTYVSAVHADSVAARDGRLKPGDRLVKVNDESVESMSTSEIIDLLRIVRGPVCIVVSRCKSNQDCTKSNAEN